MVTLVVPAPVCRTISAVLEDVFPFDPPVHDLMQGPGGIQPRLSEHIFLNTA
jgi:hypothetical protein